MKAIFDKRYPVTTGILLLTMVIFLAMQLLRFGWATSAKTIYDFGGVLGSVIKQEPWQLWRLISAMFVHIGFEHFVLNSLTIYLLGRQLEAIYGSFKFALFYFLSGIMGNIFVLFFSPNAVAAGASTALFGLFTSVVALRYFVRSPYIQALGRNYLTLLVFNLVFTFTSPGISIAGHLGGAVGGGLCAFFIPIKGEERAFTSGQRVVALLTYFALGLGLIGLRFLF